MANKKELASDLEKLTGQPVDSDALTRDELEQKLSEAKATAAQDDAPSDQAPAQADDEPAADELVEVVLGKDAPVGRLLVGRSAIERHQPGRTPARITRAEFEQHRGLYKLEIPEGDPEPNPSLADQLEGLEKGS